MYKAFQRGCVCVLPTGHEGVRLMTRYQSQSYYPLVQRRHAGTLLNPTIRAPPTPSHIHQLPLGGQTD